MTSSSKTSDAIKPPATGWFWIDNRVTDRIGEIGTTALAVYVVLARFADRDRCCYPAIDTVATDINEYGKVMFSDPGSWTEHLKMKNGSPSGSRQISPRQRGRGREAAKPSSLSDAHAAPGTRSRRLASHGARAAHGA